MIQIKAVRNQFVARVKITRNHKTVDKKRTFKKCLDATAWAEDLESRLKRDIEAQIDDRHTLEKALLRYAEEVSPTKPSGKKEVAQIKKFLKQELFPSKYKLENLTTEQFYIWRNSRNVKNSTKNREATIIQSVLETARREWKWISHNPLKDLKRLKEAQHRNRRVSTEEIDAICNELGFSFDNPHIGMQKHKVAVIALIAIETAMRRSEITKLDWSQVHIKQKFVRLKRSKNEDARDVPLSKKAIALFKIMTPTTYGSVFKISADTVSTMFKRAVIACKIQNLTFHDTRHEACTRLARKVDILTLAKILGHRDTKSLLIYYNPTATEIAELLG